jgi:hypothetical protein
MQVKIIRPCLGHEVGSVVVIANIGVAKTLISFGKCEEYNEEPKLDADKAVKPVKRTRSKSTRSKKTS